MIPYFSAASLSFKLTLISVAAIGCIGLGAYGMHWLMSARVESAKASLEASNVKLAMCSEQSASLASQIETQNKAVAEIASKSANAIAQAARAVKEIESKRVPDNSKAIDAASGCDAIVSAARGR